MDMAEQDLINIIEQMEKVAQEKSAVASAKQEEARRAADIASQIRRGVGQLISSSLRLYDGSQEKLTQGYQELLNLLALGSKIAEYDPSNAKKISEIISNYKNQIESDFGRAADTEYKLKSWSLSRQLAELQEERNLVNKVRGDFERAYQELSTRIQPQKQN